MHTPVGFLIFNRPDHTRRVFAEIAKAKPPKLFIIADGPRVAVAGEAERCAAARAVVERIDWDCDVKGNYSDENLGCKKRVASGLTWIFDQVEEAIVLEDDTLPDPTFFRFCEELLEKYRSDERIMHISGNNYQFGRRVDSHSYYFSRYDHIWGWASWRRAWRAYDGDMKLWPELRDSSWLLDILDDQFGRRVDSHSYYFSRYDHIWGWASWRRAWRAYDGDMKLWPELRDSSWLLDILDDQDEARWWHECFDRVYAGQIDTWDAQWLFAIWRLRGVAVTPNLNLVSNIGFGRASTHTHVAHPLSKLKRAPMTFPLRHPPSMSCDDAADRFAFQVACNAIVPGRGGRSITARRWRLSSGGLVGRRVKEARRLAAAAARITKNAGRKLLGRSDYNRWSNTENLESWWGARTEKIVGFIRPGARVVEFGAGSRHLEKLLDKSCVYFASDLVNRGSGTIVCDLNKRPLPDLTELSADVAVFSGVLEYIRDLDSLVAWLAGQISACVASYECVTPPATFFGALRRRIRRLYYGYMNHYSEAELLAVFARAGLVCAETTVWENQRIFFFVAREQAQRAPGS